MGLMVVTSVVGALLSYVAASTYFWTRPHLIHVKKKAVLSPGGTAMLVSHRGGSAEGYENTVKNFQKSVDSGSNMLEMDVRRTKDGKIVVFHDVNLKRLANQPFRICDVNYDKLPPLNVSVPIDSIPGEIFSDNSWSVEDRKIPLLHEVFSRFPNIPMNIDIKDNDIRLVRQVSDLIEEFKRRDITVWGSFNNSTCSFCYKTNPDICLFFSLKKVCLIILFAITGLLPFVPIKETHYEVFLPLSVKKQWLQRRSTLNIFQRFSIWMCEAFLIWKPLINHLKMRGIHVYLWVCNDDEQYEKCVELGANGIMTDYPSRLGKFLNNYEEAIPIETSLKLESVNPTK